MDNTFYLKLLVEVHQGLIRGWRAKASPSRATAHCLPCIKESDCDGWQLLDSDWRGAKRNRCARWNIPVLIEWSERIDRE